MAKKPYTGRDYLMVRLVCGATKASVHNDKKKEASRKQCRKPVRPWKETS